MHSQFLNMNADFSEFTELGIFLVLIALVLSAVKRFGYV